MGLIRTSTTATILDVLDIKDHCGIDGADLDAVLNACQRAAVDFIERECGIQVGPGEFVFTTDFPAGAAIVLPKPPLASVEVVTFIDPAGNDMALDPSEYRVNTGMRPGRLKPRPGLSWPATIGGGDAVTIEYTAGWPLGSVPEGLLHAIRLLTGHYFENREATSTLTIKEVPFAVESLLNQFRFVESV